MCKGLLLCEGLRLCSDSCLLVHLWALIDTGADRNLLQVNPEALAKALCYKNIGGSREVIFVNYTKAVASDSRDSLTKVRGLCAGGGEKTVSVCLGLRFTALSRFHLLRPNERCLTPARFPPGPPRPPPHSRAPSSCSPTPRVCVCVLTAGSVRRDVQLADFEDQQCSDGQDGRPHWRLGRCQGEALVHRCVSSACVCVCVCVWKMCRWCAPPVPFAGCVA